MKNNKSNFIFQDVPFGKLKFSSEIENAELIFSFDIAGIKQYLDIQDIEEIIDFMNESINEYRENEQSLRDDLEKVHADNYRNDKAIMRESFRDSI